MLEEKMSGISKTLKMVELFVCRRRDYKNKLIYTTKRQKQPTLRLHQWQ